MAANHELHQLQDRGIDAEQQPLLDLIKCPTYFDVYTNPNTRFENTYSILFPGKRYESASIFRHKDSLGRVWTGPDDDRYLSSQDGRLIPLVVQATEDILHGPKNSTWARSNIEKRTPRILQIVYMLLGERTGNKSLVSAIAWIPCSLAIAALLFFPVDLGGEIRNNGRYEQFKYHYWGYSKVSANIHELPSRDRTIRAAERNPHGTMQRLERPRKLCVLRPDGILPVENLKVWELKNITLSYIFVCYTAQQFCHGVEEDGKWLHEAAEDAARSAGVNAYWIASSCIDLADPEDVYRISDVVRGAHSLVVAIGSPQGSIISQKEMLQQLGSRIWTFPEVLLSPSHKPITVYIRDTGATRILSKGDFAFEAWGDIPISKQLIDHYEATIILSPLELVSIALQCFLNRKTAKSYYNGDHSYALMGLLRRRPKVNPQDSAFEAFCRLSLANDSDQLIERLICLLPRSLDGGDLDRPWYDINDFWDSNLWDIEPHCQVVGLGGENTVILSGAFGAPIHWECFEPVSLFMRNTLKRWVGKVIIRTSPLFVIIGVSLLAVSRSKGGDLLAITIFGWIFIGLYILLSLASPYFIYSLYCGKTWAAQPWLFGFEGHMRIDQIEELIFGINLGRLRWSPYSSDLSQHNENTHGECEGLDPTDRTPENLAPDSFVSEARNSEYGELKLFTLVDTNTLTVTLFRSVRPPVAMLLCGSEGGMQRALLCSYDWKTQTLCRETVLRVQTVIMEQMSRVDRFRLALKRPLGDTAEFTINVD